MERRKRHTGTTKQAGREPEKHGYLTHNDVMGHCNYCPATKYCLITPAVRVSDTGINSNNGKKKKKIKRPKAMAVAKGQPPGGIDRRRKC